MLTTFIEFSRYFAALLFGAAVAVSFAGMPKTRKNNLIFGSFVVFIFIFSILAAGFIKRPFFSSISRDRQSMLKFIVTLLGENTAKISFLSSVDSTGHPLLGPLTALMTGLANSADTGSSIESELFPDGSDSFFQNGVDFFPDIQRQRGGDYFYPGFWESFHCVHSL